MRTTPTTFPPPFRRRPQCFSDFSLSTILGSGIRKKGYRDVAIQRFRSMVGATEERTPRRCQQNGLAFVSPCPSVRPFRSRHLSAVLVIYLLKSGLDNCLLTPKFAFRKTCSIISSICFCFALFDTFTEICFPFYLIYMCQQKKHASRM